MSDKNDDYTIAVNNKEVFEFYKNNPDIDFAEANLLLISLIKTIFNKLSTNVDDNINSQILSFMKDNLIKVDSLTNSINAVKTSISNITGDVINNMENIKKDYINDFTNIINTTSLSANEKISSLIDKSNSILVDKTTLILNDIIPKNNQSLHNDISGHLKNLHTNIVSETNKLTDNINNTDFQKEFLSNIENKLSNVIQTIQQPLFSILNSSEERISNNINNIKDVTNSSVLSQNKLFGELEVFLDKYKSSTHKGRLGEEELYTVLNNIYNNAEITNTSGLKAHGDFIMKRFDKPEIMIENKEYSYNIPKEEISKFIRDIDSLNMSGIFLSQHSGIAFKQNFQIDLNNGNILIYIQNCNYDSDKIKLAVDIIDNLSSKLQDLNMNEENIVISKDILDDINCYYRNFINQKDSLQLILKDFTKKMNSQIDELSLPNLDRYLETKYAFVKDRLFKCDLCNNFSGKSKQALSAHKRGCKKKNTINVETPNLEIQLSNNLIN